MTYDHWKTTEPQPDIGAIMDTTCPLCGEPRNYSRPDGCRDTACPNDLEDIDARADWLDSLAQKHGRINTHHEYPPIPWRVFDWSAMRDDDEGEAGRPVGYGATEDEALRDLIEQLEDDE